MDPFVVRCSRRGFGFKKIATTYPQRRRRMERVTRLELATSSLARRCSTTELHPRFTYEKRPSNKAEKYACPAILSGIPSGSHENTPERCIPESSRMFVPLFIEWRLLCAVRKRWQGSPPFAADEGSRIGATRARLVKRRAEASRSCARQADAGGALRPLLRDDPASEAENGRAQGAHHAAPQIGLAHRPTYSGYEN